MIRESEGDGQCQRTTVNWSSWCTYKRQIFICKSIRKALENVLNVIYKLRLFNRSEVEEEW
jgi:hypothetical protein